MKEILLLLITFCVQFIYARTVFNVRDYGALGNGQVLDNLAFNRAIDSCVAYGGGIVYVPAGTYLCGSIHLKSNVELHLTIGAKIVAAQASMRAYDAAESYDSPMYQDGGHTFFHNSLIWAEAQENIAITGMGMIDGEGLTKKDNERAGNIISNQPINTGDKVIALKQCRNVLIRDVTIYRGGHFAIILTGCDRTTVDNVTIDTNRDGIDIDCCKYTTISNCKVNTPNDDAIVLKSTYALKRAVSCEHILINNCLVTGYKLGTFLNGTYQPETVGWVCGRIKLGTESNGGFHDIAISNCTCIYSSGLAFEEIDQGRMENIAVSNITMNHVHHYPIYITTGSRNRGPKDVTSISSCANISINNVIAQDVDSLAGIIITGMPDRSLKNISLSNIMIEYRGGGTKKLAEKIYRELGKNYPEPKFFKETPAYALFARHVEGLRISNVSFTTLQPDFRPAVMFEDVKESDINGLMIPQRRGIKQIIIKKSFNINIK